VLDVQEKSLLFKIRVLKDQKAFAVLLSKHSSALQRFLKMKLPKIEDAEDAFSVTLYRFWNYLTASEVESVSGLLFTIARSVVAEFYRSRKTENVPLEDYEVAAVDERLNEKIDAQTIVNKELKNLDDETKEMIVMRYFEGWKIKDIAKHLGKSENSTRVAIHRAVKKIRLNIKKCE
jgi:RNA polymerase sigma-70 factor (ECF subfamily)